MEQIIIGFLVLIIVVLAVFLIFKRKPEKQSEALMMVQQQINHSDASPLFLLYFFGRIETED